MRMINVPATTIARARKAAPTAPYLRRIDPAEFDATPVYVSSRGIEFSRKPGRPKKLTAEQAAMLFEAQVQERAARRLQDRILAEAGFPEPKNGRRGGARGRILMHNWLDRGRIDVLRPANPKKGKR